MRRNATSHLLFAGVIRIQFVQQFGDNHKLEVDTRCLPCDSSLRQIIYFRKVDLTTRSRELSYLPTGLNGIQLARVKASV